LGTSYFDLWPCPNRSAGIAAQAVMLTRLQADALASTQRDMNDALRDALLRQSRVAAWGLGLVALGTIVQIAGTLIVMWSHLSGVAARLRSRGRARRQARRASRRMHQVRPRGPLSRPSITAERETMTSSPPRSRRWRRGYRSPLAWPLGVTGAAPLYLLR
jgi:hypothetical protein